MPRRWLALGAFATVVVAGFVLAIVPGMTRDRDYPAEIPSPTALFTNQVVPVPPHRSACFADAVMERHSDQARFKVSLGRVRPQPLELRIEGDGLRRAVRVPPTYVDGQELHVDVPPPPRAPEVRVCLRPLGRRTVGFYASNDRTLSRSPASVGGKPAGVSIWFSFFERRPASLWDRLGDTMSRASVFRAGFVGPWLLWPLAVLFLVGVPVGTGWALWRALRDDVA